MPRVTVHTKNRGGTKVYTCTGCSKPVEPGQKYYEWSRRFGRSGRTYHRHVACGRPRPTELSSRKTAVVEEAIEAAQNEMANWNVDLPDEPSDTMTLDSSDLVSALETVADEAEGVAEEYEEGVQNMPESLQYGPTGEAMQAVADELREWADNLRNWTSFTEDGDVSLPDPADYQDGEDEDWAASWRNDAESILEDLVQQARDEAESCLDDMPEYQG